MQFPLKITVNGDVHELHVDASTSLLQFVRQQLGLTGSKEGCEDSECGACMMLVDGRPINSCSYLALQANGRTVTTVEGLAVGADLHPLQREFADLGGVQCGYCTSGMLMNAWAFLQKQPHPSREAIVQEMDGNLCRCGAHQRIIAAIQEAAGKGGAR